jgi:hypothetical protein
MLNEPSRFDKRHQPAAFNAPRLERRGQKDFYSPFFPPFFASLSRFA